MKDILLIGASGQLGKSLLKTHISSRISAPSRDELDICDRASILRCFDQYQPRVVINTAAFHNVALCETEPLRAMNINCFAVYQLAALCSARGIRLITFSTDYVFSGTQRFPYLETDPPAALQIYGISRVAGEQAAVAAAPTFAYVVRTCGLYGPEGARSKGGNFVDQRLNDATHKMQLDVSCDQTVIPTYTADLADALVALINCKEARPGIYHLVNEGECTWAEFTTAIFDECRLPIVVNPVDRGGISGGVRRPLYSVLENRRAVSLGIRLPHWRDALSRYLRTKSKFC